MKGAPWRAARTFRMQRTLSFDDDTAKMFTEGGESESARGEPHLITEPPFITKLTCSRTVTSAIGSRLTAIMSANLPASIAPTRSLQLQRSPAFTVAA